MTRRKQEILPAVVTNEKKQQIMMKMIHNVQGSVNDALTRAGYAAKLGQSYGKDRDLYEALGYPYTLTYDRYYGRYLRQDIARRIVNAFPDATWRGKPEIIEKEESDETKFEKEWKTMVKDLRVYHYLRRADRLSGIGSYGILLMGFDDVAEAKDLKTEVSSAKKLLYLQPYSQVNAEIKEFNKDASNERFGKPEIYSVNVTAGEGMSGTSIEVHWTRVLHLADDTLESDIYGTPRLQPVYNRMQDLETIVGGSAEMFWRGAYPGLSFEADKETNLDAQSMSDLEDEIKNYMHGMNRFLRLQGIKTNQLNPTIADPDKHVEVQLKMVSSVTQIPVRILTGSERGELSSTEDKENWNDRVDERRVDYAEPMILRPFIDAQMKAGTLSTVKDYLVKWPDIDASSEKEVAEINEIRIKIVKDYMTSGADTIMPPVKFLVKFLDWDEEEAKSVTAEVEHTMAEEQEQIMADEKAKAEAELAFAKQTGARPPAPVGV